MAKSKETTKPGFAVPALTRDNVDLKTTLFLIGVHLFGIAGAVYMGFNYVPQTLILSIVLFILGGMGITVGYHRLFSHRAYSATIPFRILVTAMGTLAGQSSAIEWSIDHRIHHQRVDREEDPYAITKGFWFAHFLWLFYERDRDLNPDNAPDLWKDPVLKFQYDHYGLLLIGSTFVLPMLIAGLGWGDWIGGLLVAGAMRLMFTYQTTWCINSVAHVFGSQPYSDKHTSRDNWLTAFVTFGEGYHNYHHEFSSDYRNGIHWYQFDPSKWMIRSAAWFGLTYDLKRIPDERILQKRLAMKQKRTLEKLNSAERTAAEHKLGPAWDQLQKAIERIASARKEKKAGAKHSDRLRVYRRNFQASAEAYLKLLRSLQPAS